MVGLHNTYGAQGLEILAFPCNQFGGQEPGTAGEIKAFAQSKGARFTIMSKVDVNGPHTDPVYHWLKTATGEPDMTWNFATYFLVDRRGGVRAYSGHSPRALEQLIQSLLEQAGPAGGDL